MDVELIAVITGFPLAGIDPTQYLPKDQDTVVMTMVKDTYDLTKANRGFLISSINDYIVLFDVKVLSCKMLCKIRPTQCTAGGVVLAELCVEGVHINWSQFPLNELLEYAAMSQESGRYFH